MILHYCVRHRSKLTDCATYLLCMESRTLFLSKWRKAFELSISRLKTKKKRKEKKDYCGLTDFNRLMNRMVNGISLLRTFHLFYSLMISLYTHHNWFYCAVTCFNHEFLSNCRILKFKEFRHTVLCPIILSFVFQGRSGWGLTPLSLQPQCNNYFFILCIFTNFWIKVIKIHIVFKSYLKPSAVIHWMQWLNKPFLFQIINTEWKVNLQVLFNSV